MFVTSNNCSLFKEIQAISCFTANYLIIPAILKKDTLNKAYFHFFIMENR